MTTDGDAGTPDEPAQPDPYDTRRTWPTSIETFAARWRLDAGDLSRSLNVALAAAEVKVEDDPGASRDELRRIAKRAADLVRDVDAASDRTIVSLSIGLFAPPHPNLFQHPDPYRRRLGDLFRKVAAQAETMARQLKVTRRPRATGRGATSPPTLRESAVVHCLADLWRRTHGTWPNVTNRRTKEGDDRRAANEGGRFVIDAAAFFGLHLTPQRLRTALASGKPPATET
jgi:hypothetical protein